MTFKRCKKKPNMPYDIYIEMLKYADPFEELEFIVIERVYCHKGDMLPTKFLNKKQYKYCTQVNKVISLT